MSLGILLDAAVSFIGMAITYFILYKLVKYITFFSKGFFALVISGILSRYVTVVSGSDIGNFAALFGISLVICLLISLLPRVNFAITYLCDYLLILIISTIFLDMGLKHFDENFSLSTILTVCVCIIDAFLAYKLIHRQIDGGTDLTFSPLRIADRVVASLINSGTFFTAVLVSVNFPDNVPLFVAAWIGVAVLMYVADIFLFDSITSTACRVIPRENFGPVMSGVSSVFSGSDSDNYRYQDNNDYNDNIRRQWEMQEELYRVDEERAEWARQEKEQRDFDRWYKENYGD